MRRASGMKNMHLSGLGGGCARSRRSAWVRTLLAAAIVITGFSASRATAQQGSAASGLEGTWEGILGGRLHLVVTISKASNGDLAGQLNSVDQGATLPIEKATQDGGDRKSTRLNSS